MSSFVTDITVQTFANAAVTNANIAHIDILSPRFAPDVMITSNFVPSVDATLDLGNSQLSFGNTYSNNMYANTFHPQNDGNLTCFGNILPSLDKTYDMGAPHKRWKNIYTDNLSVSGNAVLIDTHTNIVNVTDETKRFEFFAGAISSGQTRVFTMPNSSDTLVGRNTTDTLINKTLTSNTDNVIARGLWDTSGAGSVSTYASSAPTTGQVLIATSSTTATWQTISTSVTPQVTFGDSEFTIYNLVDNTKQLLFNNVLATTGTSTTISTAQTANETLTLPNASDTLVGRSTTDTLTNKTLTSNTDNVIARGLWDSSGAGSVSTYASSAPTTGQVLIATNSTTATWQSINTIVTPQVTFGDAEFAIYGVADNTKHLLFNNLLATTGTATTLATTQTMNETLTLPNISDTLVGRSTTDTLINKTLTSNTNNVIARGLWDTSGAGLVSTYASAAPTTGQVLIATNSTTATWQSINTIVTPQVTFGDSEFTIYGVTDNTKQLVFNNSLATTGTSTTIATTQVGNETLTLPNTSDTIVGRSTVDTLTNKTLTSNTDNIIARGLWDTSGAGSVSTYASSAPSTGQVLIATTSTTATWQSINAIVTPQVTFGDSEFAIYNLADNTKQLLFNNSLATTGTSTTMQTTQIASETLTLPNIGDTLVGRSTTDTLTNKTLTSPSDNVIARGLWDSSGAGTVSTYASVAPITGQVLIATSSSTATWQSISAIVTPQVTFGDNEFAIYGVTDNTKQLVFNNSLATTGTATTLTTTQTANETLTLPNVSDTIVGRSTVDTLTNKILTSNTDNVIARGLWDTSGAGSVSTYASSAPTTGQVLIATSASTATWQSIGAIVTPQVTFGDSEFAIYNTTDNTKQLLFNNSLATTGTSTTVEITQIGNETLTLPNVSDTLVGRNTTDTLINKTLTSNTDNIISRGLWDSSGSNSVSTYASTAPTTGQILIATSATTATWQNISNIEITTFSDAEFAIYGVNDNTKQLLFNNSLAATGTSTTVQTTQTASETLTLPNVSDTIVGRSTVDTLTNKTLTSNTDNVIARGLWDTSGANSVSTYASSAPTTGQVLIATNSTTATWQSINAIVTPQVTFGDTEFVIYNTTDNTKQLLFNNGIATTGTSTTIEITQTANETLTLPNVSDTLIGRSTTDTLLNKTLTSNTDNVISRGLWDTSGANSVSTYASSAPTTGQVLIATNSTTATWQNISNILIPQVTFGDAEFAVYNVTDNTKQLVFNNSLATTGTSTTIEITQTASETLTLPNVSDTLVGRSTTDTLINKNLTSNTDNIIARGLWDSSGAGSVSTYASSAPTTGQILIATSATTATWQNVSNIEITTFSDSEFSIYNILDNTKQLLFNNSLATTGTSTTVETTQITSETLTLPNVSDTLVGRSTTDTLINKTLTSNTDNIIARGLWDSSGAGSVSTYASSAPTTGQILIATSATTATWQNVNNIEITTFSDAEFAIYNISDNTKQLVFNNSLATTGTSTTVEITQTVNETLTLPNVSDTLVGRSTTDTLINKTLTSNTDNIIARGLWDTSGSGSVSTYASAAPTTGQYLVATNSTTATWQSLPITATQVTFGDSEFAIYNVTDNTKQLLFNNVLATTGTTTTLNTTQTANETLTLPNVSDSLIGRSTTDTLTNKTLTSNTDNVLARGLWDTSGAGSVSTYASSAPTTGQYLVATNSTTATWQSLPITATQVTFGDSEFAVYNATDNTKQLLFNNVLATTATSTTLATTQTANETLTLPNVSDTLVGRSTTDILTNKTLTSNTDNIIARALWDSSGSGSVSTYASSAPTTGQVLIATNSTTATWQSINAIVTPQVTFGDSEFAIYNLTDNTKQLLFNNASASTGTSTTVQITQTASETLTLPNVSDTIVGRSTTDTLTNKTLTSNTDNILARGLWDTSGAGSVSTYASVAPITGQVLIATTSTTATWQSISAIVTPQVTFGDSEFAIYNLTDNTKQLFFNNASASTGTSTTIQTTQTANETLTLPNVSDTIVGRSTTDTLTNKTLTSNTNNILARGLWDTSGAGSVSTYASVAPTTGQVLIATTSTTATWQSISAIVTPQVTFGDSEFAIYNLTDNTKQLLFNNGLATTGTSTTLATTQTINETLTLPNISDTLVGRSSTDTLINKTLTSNTNNILARGLWDTSGTGSVSTYASTAPTTGQVLIATTSTTATWQSISAIVTPQVTFGDSEFAIYGVTDNTKQLFFNNGLATTGTSTTLTTTQTNNETITLPNVSDTIVGRSTTDTLTNKTLTSNTDNIIARGLWDTSGSGSVSTYASAAPTTGQVLIATNSTTATWQSISAIVTPQVTFGDAEFAIYGVADNTKQLLFNNAQATTGTSTTLAITQTASETLTLPNVSDTLVGRSSTDTLTNKTLTSNTDNIIARGLWDSSGSGSVSTYAATAPTTGQALIATSSSVATWQSVVTSVAMTVPSILSVSGSPITTTGTLAVSLSTETANTVFAGPTSGSAATPTFRSLIAADLPQTGVTSYPWTATSDLSHPYVAYSSFYYIGPNKNQQTASGPMTAFGQDCCLGCGITPFLVPQTITVRYSVSGIGENATTGTTVTLKLYSTNTVASGVAPSPQVQTPSSGSVTITISSLPTSGTITYTSFTGSPTTTSVWTLVLDADTVSANNFAIGGSMSIV